MTASHDNVGLRSGQINVVRSRTESTVSVRGRAATELIQRPVQGPKLKHNNNRSQTK